MLDTFFMDIAGVEGALHLAEWSLQQEWNNFITRDILNLNANTENVSFCKVTDNLTFK